MGKDAHGGGGHHHDEHDNYKWDLSSMEFSELFSFGTLIFLTKVLLAASIVAFGPALVLEYVPAKKVDVRDMDKAGSWAGRTQRLLLAFAGGGLMAEAALHLLPHLFMPHDSHDDHGDDHGAGHHVPIADTYALIALGFLATFAIDRFVGRSAVVVAGAHGAAAATGGTHDVAHSSTHDDVGDRHEHTPASEQVTAKESTPTEETASSTVPPPANSDESSLNKEETEPTTVAPAADTEVRAKPAALPEVAPPADAAVPAINGDSAGDAGVEVPVATAREDDVVEQPGPSTTTTAVEEVNEGEGLPEKADHVEVERTVVALTTGMGELQEVVPDEDEEDIFIATADKLSTEAAEALPAENCTEKSDAAVTTPAVGDSSGDYDDVAEGKGDKAEALVEIPAPSARPDADELKIPADREAIDVSAIENATDNREGDQAGRAEAVVDAVMKVADAVPPTDDGDEGDKGISPDENPRAIDETSAEAPSPSATKEEGGQTAVEPLVPENTTTAEQEKEPVGEGDEEPTADIFPTATSGTENTAVMEGITVVGEPPAVEQSTEVAQLPSAPEVDCAAVTASSPDASQAKSLGTTTVRSEEENNGQPELTLYGNLRTPLPEEDGDKTKGLDHVDEAGVPGDEPRGVASDSTDTLVKEEHETSKGQDHGSHDDHHHHHDDHGEAEGGAYATLAVDVLHNIIDGVGLGAAFALGGDTMGYITALLKLIHEIQHEVGDVATLVQYGMSKHHAIHIQHTTAAGVFLGVAISLGASAFPTGLLSLLLALSAGATFHLASGTILGPVLAIPAGVGGPYQAFLEILALSTGALGVVAIGFAEKVAGIGH